MSGIADFEAQFHYRLQARLGSERTFDQWLNELEAIDFAPVMDKDVGTQLLDVNGGAGPATGTVAYSPGEVLAGLDHESIDWRGLIVEKLKAAKLEWPEIVERHKAVVDRIERVLQ